jgi:hypothetical protein
MEVDQSALRLVRNAIKVSRDLAKRGRIDGARRVWLMASRNAHKCGGLSGAVWAGDRRGGIVLADGTVAVSPVQLN